jgi:hypothetical protein
MLKDLQDNYFNMQEKNVKSLLTIINLESF